MDCCWCWLLSLSLSCTLLLSTRLAVYPFTVPGVLRRRQRQPLCLPLPPYIYGYKLTSFNPPLPFFLLFTQYSRQSTHALGSFTSSQHSCHLDFVSFEFYFGFTSYIFELHLHKLPSESSPSIVVVELHPRRAVTLYLSLCFIHHRPSNIP